MRGPWALGPAALRQPGRPGASPRPPAASAASTAPPTAGASNPLRRQPPAYSPITMAGLARGLAALTGFVDDPRPALARRLAEEFGADEATLWGSGTDALRLAIRRAMAEAASPEVALPAYTCFSVASAAVGARASVSLYDVDPGTLGPDLADLERVVAAGARVVVVSPLWGVPVDWDAVADVLEAHGAVGIEDAAQGHGAAWRGRPLGSFGRFAVLSFGRGKGWTGGAGGVVLSRAPDAASGEPPGEAAPAVDVAVLAAAAAQWALGRPSLYGLPSRMPMLRLGETRYVEPRVPRRLARTAAALLEAGREEAAAEAAARRANAAFFAGRLPGARGVEAVRVDPRAVPGFLRFPVRTAGGWCGLAEPVRAAALGMAPGYPSTLAELAPVRARMGRRAGGAEWPGAAELARRLVTLPTHSRLDASERDGVLAALGVR